MQIYGRPKQTVHYSRFDDKSVFQDVKGSPHGSVYKDMKKNDRSLGVTQTGQNFSTQDPGMLYHLSPHIL